MRNFQDIFETRKQSVISAFSICMTVTLISDLSVSDEIFKTSENSFEKCLPTEVCR